MNRRYRTAVLPFVPVNPGWVMESAIAPSLPHHLSLAVQIADELAAGEWVPDRLIADYRRAKREAERV